MDTSQPKARVFISCGQNTSDEVRLAREIHDLLAKSEFDTYIADLEHTQQEVMQAVLGALEASEYLLSIDFRREKLGGQRGRKKVFRGSLFTHQELAIATFLEIEQLRFREKGVEWNGISKLLQGKPIKFTDRTQLVAKVHDEIKRRNWCSAWKNALRIQDEPKIDSIPRSTGGTADFYHIVVENTNHRKLALDCRVFLELSPKNGANPPLALRDHVEQKWAGVLYSQAVAIRPKPGQRRACAFYVERNTAGKSHGVFFHQFGIDTDSAEVVQPCPKGEYLLKYTVVSANFPTADRIFELVIDEELEISRFKAISDS